MKQIPLHLLQERDPEALTHQVEKYAHEETRRMPDEFYEIEVEEASIERRWQEAPWHVFRSMIRRT